MARKTRDPLWVVRGVSREQDVTLVIEAPSSVQADCFASKRGIDVIVIAEATDADVATASEAGRLWRYTPVPRLTCFGRPVGHVQSALLVVLGLATVVLDLRAHHVPMRLLW